MQPANVATLLMDFNRGRDPELLARKFAIMRKGAFAFMRGSCHLYYRAWPATPILDSAPAAWISGDLHVENFGSFKGDDRLTYFDVNDFDEAALAPGTWDIARLLSSLLVSGPAIGLNVSEAETLARGALEAYAAQIRLATPLVVDRETAVGIVRELLAQADRRTRAELLDRYTVSKAGTRLLVPDNHHVLPIGTADRHSVEEIVAAIARPADAPEFYRVLDVARRVAGTGALGVRRYVALVEGHGSPDHNVLIDIKQELPSSVAPRTPAAQPRWASEGERVCAVQHRAQAVSPALLRSADEREGSFVVRELQPSADRVDLAAWSGKQHKLGHAAQLFASMAAWAHLRTAGWRGAASIDDWVTFGHRDDWHEPLFERARAGAAQNANDYAAFTGAYDRGEFGPSSAH